MLWETLASLGGAILAVLVIIGLAYWFTRYVAGSGLLGGVRTSGGDGQMKVLAQLSLGKDQRLVVAAVGERCFLLGVTPGGVSLVAELTAEEAAMWQQPEEKTPPPNFREALRAYTQKKR